MTTQQKNELVERIITVLRDMRCLTEDKSGDGYFYGDIYADYRDEMEDTTAGEILLSKDPQIALEEKLDEWYMDTGFDYKDEVEKDVRKELEKDEEAFPGGLDDEAEEVVSEVVSERVWFNYPLSHYLNQEFYVNIMVDTGDGNYDYVLNSVYPCWYGSYGERIDGKAGIVWLAKTQGYNKTQLWKALKDGDMADPHGFLESMRVELANLPSHMSTVTFLVKMTLQQLISLNTAINRVEQAGPIYDVEKRKDFGYIILGKETMTGLYDPWSGGGSVFEIELERDVKLPVKYIRCAMPDDAKCCHEYSVGTVYGMCRSAWRDTLKEMRLTELKEAS